jgi:exosome complex RNA-binding protein Csl4
VEEIQTILHDNQNLEWEAELCQQADIVKAAVVGFHKSMYYLSFGHLDVSTDR